MLSQRDGMEQLEQLPFSPQWIEFIRAHDLFKPNSGSDWALCRWAIAHFESPLAFQEVLKSAGAIGEHAAPYCCEGSTTRIASLSLLIFSELGAYL